MSEQCTSAPVCQEGEKWAGFQPRELVKVVKGFWKHAVVIHGANDAGRALVRLDSTGELLVCDPDNIRYRDYRQERLRSASDTILGATKEPRQRANAPGPGHGGSVR